MGSLLDYIHTLAKKEGHTYIYISTEEIGLYEKYGYRFWKIMKDVDGHDSRVYRMKLENKTFSRISLVSRLSQLTNARLQTISRAGVV